MRRAPSEQTIPILEHTPHSSFGSYQLPGVDERTPSLSSSSTEDMASSQATTTASPDYFDHLQFFSIEGTQASPGHYSLAGITLEDGSPHTLFNVSDTRVSDWAESFFKHGVDFEKSPVVTNVSSQRFHGYPDVLGEREPDLELTRLSMPPTVSPPYNQRHSGLTNQCPSRLRNPTPLEARLENRIIRLWDCTDIFARANTYSGASAITTLFGDAFSTLFRWSRQLAENGVSSKLTFLGRTRR